jgi:hypothetical protein
VTQSTPDVMQAVKQEAPLYLGDVSSMSDDQIKSKIKNLAKSRPDTARQMVDSVCSALDRTTGGQYHDQLDRLEHIVVTKLGLDPSALPPPENGGASPRPMGGQSASSQQASGRPADLRPGSASGSSKRGSSQAGSSQTSPQTSSPQMGGSQAGSPQAGGSQARNPQPSGSQARSPQAGNQQAGNRQPGKPGNPQKGNR